MLTGLQPLQELLGEPIPGLFYFWWLLALLALLCLHIIYPVSPCLSYKDACDCI